MLFYLIFPVVALLIPNLRAALITFVVVCILSDSARGAMQEAGLGTFAYMNIVTHLPNFVAGVASYRIWQTTRFARSRGGWLLLVVALALTVGLMVGPLSHLLALRVSPFAPFYAWSIVFSLLILATCTTTIGLLERGPLRHLGQISFSFYLLHPLVLLGLIKLDLVGGLSWLTADVGLRFLLGSALAVAIVWAASTVTFRWIEAPGIALGRRVAARMKGASDTLAVPQSSGQDPAPSSASLARPGIADPAAARTESIARRFLLKCNELLTHVTKLSPEGRPTASHDRTPEYVLNSMEQLAVLQKIVVTVPMSAHDPAGWRRRVGYRKAG